MKEINVENNLNSGVHTYINAVDHPAHYAEGRKYEPIDVILDWDLNFPLGNTVKYISRAGRKVDALEDLKKAAWYLDYEIKRLEEVWTKTIK